jgi:hypothetical protein
MQIAVMDKLQQQMTLFWFRISWWEISPPPVTDRRATAPSGV